MKRPASRKARPKATKAGRPLGSTVVAGNPRATARLPAVLGEAGATRVQAKLRVGEPNDKFEQEADRVADEVMRVPDSAVATAASSGAGVSGATGSLSARALAESRGSDAASVTTPSLQRLCSECAGEETDKLQRTPLPPQPVAPRISALHGPLKARFELPSHHTSIQRQELPAPISEQVDTPRIQRLCPECEEELQRQPMENQEEEETTRAKETTDRTPKVTPAVQAQINGLRGSGHPLPESVRAFFEPRFGRDFGVVRAHTDLQAAEAAQAVNARAFTVGREVVFGAGEYAPGTAAGRHLLAHELTHVVQQGAAVHSGTEAVAQTIRRAPAIGDAALCEGTEFPPAAVWFTHPVLVRIRADEVLMAFGSIGDPVALMQQAVVAWGCDEGLGHLLPKFGVDGIFGSETRGAVKTFQKQQGIVDDGIVGPITMSRFDGFIYGDLATCPFGTTPAAFVSEPQSKTMQTICLPPGIQPLPLTGVCAGRCTPQDFSPPPPYPPTTPTSAVGDLCIAKQCAPVALLGGGDDCLAAGDRVQVMERKILKLKGGPPDAWLTVVVLDGALAGDTVKIRERFLEDCRDCTIPTITGPNEVDHYCADYVPSDAATCPKFPAPNITLTLGGVGGGTAPTWGIVSSGVGGASIVGANTGASVNIRGDAASSAQDDVIVEVTDGPCRFVHRLTVREPRRMTAHESPSSGPTFVQNIIIYTVRDQFNNAMGKDICVDETVTLCRAIPPGGTVDAHDHPTDASGKVKDKLRVEFPGGVPSNLCIRSDQNITAGGCGPLLQQTLLFFQNNAMRIPGASCKPGDPCP